MQHDWLTWEQTLRGVMSAHNPKGHYQAYVWWLGLAPGFLAWLMLLAYVISGRFNGDSEAERETFTSKWLMLTTLAYVCCPIVFIPLILLALFIHPVTSWLVIPAFFINLWIYSGSRPAWNVGIFILTLFISIFGLSVFQYIAFSQFIVLFNLGLLLGTAAFLLYILPFLAWDRYAAHAYREAISLGLMATCVPMASTYIVLHYIFPGLLA